MNGFRISSKADLLKSVGQCAREAPHLVPLLMAAHRDELSLAFVGPGKAAPLRMLGRARTPVTVVLGDDYGIGFDPGPAGFHGLPRLMRWARFVVINASGGDRAHYEEFVRMTVEHRKLVLIETGTDRAGAWLEVCRRAQVLTLVIRPEDGGVHPVTARREVLH